jgi:sec-independent protein translocase protein TatA
MSVLAYGMPLGLGPMELVIILVILVLLFGATRLADIGSGLGKGIKEFRKNVQDDDKEKESEQPAAPAPPAQQNQASAGVTSSNGGTETVSAVKCSNCGALNPVGAKHCNQCGTAIVATVS